MRDGSPGFESPSYDFSPQSPPGQDPCESDAHYRGLFNATRNGVVVYRACDEARDFVIADFNRAAEQLEHTTRAQVVGRRVTEVFPGVSQFGLLDVMRRVWTTGQPERHPVSFYEDGRVRGWRDNFVYRLPSGEVVAVYDDVTERRQFARSLADQLASLQTILDAIPSPVFYKDLDGRYLGCNKAFAAFIGRSQSEIIGRTIHDLAAPDLAAVYDAKDAELLRHPVTQTYEGLIPFADGSLRNVEIHKAVYTHGNGAVAGIVGTWLDITERTRGEETLRDSEERFRRIFEEGPVGMATTGPDCRFLRANAAFCSMLGYTEEELSALTFRDLTHADHLNASAEAVARLMRGESQIYRAEKPYRRKDGEAVWGALTLSPIRDREGRLQYFLVMVRDITARKRAEEELRQSLERLRSAMGGIVRAMVMAVEARDPYTAGHQRRVAQLASAIATEMGLPREVIEGIRYASLIHDIGKISVPAEILSKPMRLSVPEMGIVRTHPQSGFEILKDIDFPWPIATIILQHHERLDGSGYPSGLHGSEICIEAKVLGVADVVDAVASHRPYRPALGIDAAVDELVSQRGVLYDTSTVDACVRLFRERGFTLSDLG